MLSYVLQSKTFVIVENYVTGAAISQPKESELWRQLLIECKRAEEKDRLKHVHIKTIISSSPHYRTIPDAD